MAGKFTPTFRNPYYFSPEEAYESVLEFAKKGNVKKVQFYLCLLPNIPLDFFHKVIRILRDLNKFSQLHEEFKNLYYQYQ
jgi:2-iminoacetate synthase ThiH